MTTNKSAKIIVTQRLGWTLIGALIASLVTVTWLYVGFRLDTADVRIGRLESLVTSNALQVGIVMNEMRNMNASVQGLVTDQKQLGKIIQQNFGKLK